MRRISLTLITLLIAACSLAPSAPAPTAVQDPSGLTPKDLVAWDERAMQLVRSFDISPTIAAQLYAALAMGQYEMLHAGAGAAAFTEVGEGVLCRFTPKCAPAAPTDATRAFFTALDARRTTMKDAPIPKRPDGEYVWYGTNPTTPNAGGWKHWVSDDTLDALPPPPAPGSPEDAAEIEAVRAATLAATPQQLLAVQAWAGGLGTVTPGGMWLEKLDAVLATKTDVQTAALDRAAFAGAVADAFVLCWEGKFTYWTQRPDIRDREIRTNIMTPNFPSYPSGHATISEAAAQVLEAYTGDAQYLAASHEAADSRVWGGIHFPVDAVGGQALGQAVAKSALAWRDAQLRG